MDKETLTTAKYLDKLIQDYSSRIETIKREYEHRPYNVSIRITAGLNDLDCNVHVPRTYNETIIKYTIGWYEHEIREAEGKLKQL